MLALVTDPRLIPAPVRVAVAVASRASAAEALRLTPVNTAPLTVTPVAFANAPEAAVSEPPETMTAPPKVLAMERVRAPAPDLVKVPDEPTTGLARDTVTAPGMSMEPPAGPMVIPRLAVDVSEAAYLRPPPFKTTASARAPWRAPSAASLATDTRPPSTTSPPRKLLPATASPSALTGVKERTPVPFLTMAMFPSIVPPKTVSVAWLTVSVFVVNEPLMMFPEAPASEPTCWS